MTMSDQAFDLSRVRGLGAPPLPVPPSSPREAGLGQGMAEGRLPHGIMPVGPQTQCKTWMLAFVNGARKANVAHLGSGFSYQSVLNYFASLTPRATHFFTYTGSGGTILFAFEWHGDVPVIKVCVDGLHVAHTPMAHAAWTVARPHAMGRAKGVGVVFPGEPAGYSLGSPTITVVPIPGGIVRGTFVLVYPGDPTGQTGIASQLAGDINSIMPQINAMIAGGVSSDGHVYFGMSDGHQGAAQTPGEPPGMVILRATNSGAGVSVEMCTSNDTLTVGSVSGATAMPSAPLPPPGVVTWWMNAWAYVARAGAPPPVAPPPGIGTGAATGAVLGTWVRTRQLNPGGLWIWFPPAGQIAILNGVYVWANAAALNTPGVPVWSAVPAPTVQPVAGGVWQQQHEGYWVYSIPASTGVAAATSYSWLWWLIGLGALGVGGYYLLD